MGPVSKEEVCSTLGSLIDAAEQQRVLLERLERMLQRLSETENADLVQFNQRLTKLERHVRGNAAPEPAE